MKFQNPSLQQQQPFYAFWDSLYLVGNENIKCRKDCYANITDPL